MEQYVCTLLCKGLPELWAQKASAGTSIYPCNLSQVFHNTFNYSSFCQLLLMLQLKSFTLSLLFEAANTTCRFTAGMISRHTSRWVGSVYYAPEQRDASVSLDRLHVHCLVHCFYWTQKHHTDTFPQSQIPIHLAIKNDNIFTLSSGIGYQAPPAWTVNTIVKMQVLPHTMLAIRAAHRI